MQIQFYSEVFLFSVMDTFLNQLQRSSVAVQGARDKKT